MSEFILNIALTIALLPLGGAVIAGFLGKCIGRQATHRVTIGFMTIAFIFSCYLLKLVFFNHATFSGTIYHWISVGGVHFDVGFLIDHLTAWMVFTVSLISWLVHIYTIGYMAEDDGYQRFFAYISLFTFAMYFLVMANNFMQLFFGWEGVGLVSYLLIGFWYRREAAISGSLKAFLVNRVGDFGFLLGLAAIMAYFGSLDYATVFAKAPAVHQADMTISILSGHAWSVLTVITLLLFIGAMGKSAQVPLHVWLPASMEGPTPISALIHAATMVTAGVFMVSRMSPLFELSETTLNFILIIGSTGALFLGLIGIVQHDIKRVIAYSTLSQLGYMIAALGASAYAAGLFHLFTHACFKALLFLGAGSVIMGLHHEQDMRQMGGLKKYMPMTYVTFLIGTLSLVALPPFSGFYSKDAIIEAIHASQMPGAHYAYYCVLFGAFVTSIYSFRVLFLTFHGEERMSESVRSHLKESPWVVWLPLLVLAVPSILQGAMMAEGTLYPKTHHILGHALYILPQHDVLAALAPEFQSWWHALFHSVTTLPFWFSIAGAVTAWYFCLSAPDARISLIRWTKTPLYPSHSSIRL